MYNCEGEYYFHTWTYEGAIKRHPEDSNKDHVYSYAKAVVENIETGDVSEVFPDEITFIIKAADNED